MGQGLFIPLVHDSVIITGLRSVTYTFGSRFTYKRWVRVLSKIWILAFLGKYSNIDCWVSKRVNWGSHHILILFVGSQCVSIEVCIIWYQSTGSKISFLSLLSFVSCYHPILFLLCSLFFVLILWRALGQNRAPSSKKKKKKMWKKKDFRKEIENRKKKKFVRSFNSPKSKYYFLLPFSFDLVFLSYFLAIGISLDTTSWISW